MALEDDVADLLTRSVFHHRAAVVVRNRHLNGWKVLLALAFVLRKAANSLDPNQTAPAWRDERLEFYRGINEQLLLFYGRHLP